MLFFTGLSGSGKSTLARALMDRVLEQGVRSVTSLDGDVVRRNLSRRPDRSPRPTARPTSAASAGWPRRSHATAGWPSSARSRRSPRPAQTCATMVEDAGGAFFLIHVATPLEECERRDRKGLYAKARRGEIPEFTGISSPYEEPDDAAVRVDTTGRTIEAALDDVIEALAESGHLDLRDDPPVEQRGTSGSKPGPPTTPSTSSSSARRTSAVRLHGDHAPGHSPATPPITFASAGTHGCRDGADGRGDGGDPGRRRPDVPQPADDARPRRVGRPDPDRGGTHRAFVMEEHPQCAGQGLHAGSVRQRSRRSSPSCVVAS